MILPHLAKEGVGFAGAYLSACGRRQLGHASVEDRENALRAVAVRSHARRHIICRDARRAAGGIPMHAELREDSLPNIGGAASWTSIRPFSSTAPSV